MKHDSGYHLLFSNPILVRELIEGFVTQPWVKDIDFNTLERVNAKMHSSQLDRREGDVIYKLQSFSGKPVYVYLFLEFQSKPDHWMALRLSVYVQLFWQHLIKEQQLTKVKTLPPVFPLVLYNGDTRWNSPVLLSELIDLPSNSSLQAYQPEMQYYLLDEGLYSVKQSGVKATDRVGNSLIDMLFKLENCTDVKHIHVLLRELLEVMNRPEYAIIKRDIVSWISEVRLPGMAQKLKTGIMSTQLHQDLNKLTEERVMLADRVRQWEKDFIKQGIEKGIEQGKELSLHETVLKLMQIKFGDLSEDVIRTLVNSKSSELNQYIERILSAETIEDVLQA